ncbi:MAG: spore protease YyaC [Eubacterium sp.]|jgi:putative sporulation protein YyaC|nr:spore protease YyaC [Eubacterium sp.]
MIYYFNPADRHALSEFSRTLSILMRKHDISNRETVIVCIGSDRATGDSLGPIVGHFLAMHQKNFHLYGTLENPVHAKNLEDALEFIRKNHRNPVIIAVDASLGIAEHVGYITVGEGSLAPGVGVSKDLPSVGDLFITGIVNLSGFGGQMLLQTTRLNLVMRLADFIYRGLNRSLIREYGSSSSSHSKLSPALQRAE